jgi:AcrR family transcriptional regulator
MHERLSRQERKSQTRDHLLDAAAKLFAERGFEAASIDEIAAAAGYTKGAVYSNFASKTDLVIALIQRRIEVQSAQYAERFAGRNSDEIASEMLKSVDELAESEKQFIILAVEFWLHAMRDERARVLIAEQYELSRTFVGKFLVDSGYDDRVEEPRLSPRDMAIVIEALGTGLAMQALLDPARVRLGIEADVMAKLVGMPSTAKE